MDRAEVVSSTRGRMRLRVMPPQGSSERLQRIAEALDARPDLSAAGVNALAGSVVIYHPDEIDALAQVRETLDPLEIEVAERGLRERSQAVDSSIAERISGVASRLDAAVDRATDGVPLRTLIPLGLGALAVRQALRSDARLGEAPWYLLGWYAFDGFLKLHGPADTTPAPAPAPPRPAAPRNAKQRSRDG